MNKIGKNYLKSFIKDGFILTLITIYLILMFVIVFVISNLSLQTFSQYNEIKEKSANWSSGYSDSHDYEWKFINLLNGKKTKFYKLVSNLEDNDGHKLLTDNWYDNIIHKQLKISSISDESSEKEFDNAFNMDISIFSFLATNENFDSLGSKTLATSEIKVEDVFNVSESEKNFWEDNNFSFNKILFQKISSLSDDDYSNNIFGYNQLLTVKNYVGSATSDINSKPTDANISQILRQTLCITFADNKYRKNLSNVFLQKNKGTMPKKDNEILVNKQFAKENNWKIGDKIQLFGNYSIYDEILKSKEAKELTKKEFTIVGYSLSLSTSAVVSGNEDTSSSLMNSNNTSSYGNIYTTYNEYNNIKNIIYTEITNEPDYSISNFQWTTSSSVNNVLLDFVTDNRESLALLSNNPNQLNNFVNTITDNKYLLSGTPTDASSDFKNSAVYKDMTNNKITIIIDLILLTFISLFSFVFLNLTIKRDINNSKRQLGIFKASGYKTNELAWIYTYKVLVTFFVASILSYLLSIPLQIYSYNAMVNSSGNVILTLTKINYMPLFLIFMFIGVPLVFASLSFLINLKFLKMPALNLIYDNEKSKNIWLLNISKKISIRKRSNISRLKKSFTIKSLWKWFAMWFIFGFSLSALILDSSSAVAIDNILENSLTSQYKNTKTKSTYNSWNIADGALDLNTKKDHFQLKNDTSSFLIQNNDDPKIKSTIDESVEYWKTSSTDPLTTQIKDHPYIDINTLMSLMPSVTSSTSSKITNKKYVDSNQSLIMNLEYLEYNNPNAIVSLNAITLSANNNFYLFCNKISSPEELQKYNSSINIYGIDDRTSWGESNFNRFKDFYNLPGITEDQYDQIAYNKDNNFIPVIISTNFAKKMNYQINETISDYSISPFGVNNYKDNNKINGIKLKIVGIINNLYNEDIFTSYDNLAQFYMKKDGTDYTDGTEEGTDYSLINFYLNNVNIYPNFKNLNDIYNSWTNTLTDPKNTNDLNLNYFHITANNNVNLITDSTTLSEYFELIYQYKIGIDYTNISSFMNIEQINGTINDLGKTVRILNDIEIVFMLLLVCILIIILLTIIIDENKRAIMLFKIIGYEDWKINWITAGNIIFVIIASFIFAIIYSKILLTIIENFIAKKFDFYISIPLDVNRITIIGIIILSMSILIWKICMRLIKNKKVEELYKYD